MAENKVVPLLQELSLPHNHYSKLFMGTAQGRMGG